MNKKMGIAIGIAVGIAIATTSCLCYHNSVNRYVKKFYKNQMTYEKLEMKQDKLHDDNEKIRAILLEKGLVFPEAGQITMN